MGESATCLPVGRTNAIGVTLPTRGGGADAGRTVGAAPLASAGNGSNRASSASVSARESDVTGAVVEILPVAPTVAFKAPRLASAIATVGRPPGAAGGVDGAVETTCGRTAAGCGVRQPPKASAHAVHTHTTERNRSRIAGVSDNRH